MIQESTINKLVERYVGKSESKVVELLLKGAKRGYDKEKLRDKLAEYVPDTAKAIKLCDRFFEELSTTDSDKKSSRKRTENDSSRNGDGGPKKRKFEERSSEKSNRAHDDSRSDRTAHPQLKLKRELTSRENSPDDVISTSSSANGKTNVKRYDDDSKDFIKSEDGFDQKHTLNVLAHAKVHIAKFKQNIQKGSGTVGSIGTATVPAGHGGNPFASALLSRYEDESSFATTKKLGKNEAMKFLNQALEQQQKITDLKARVSARFGTVMDKAKATTATPLSKNEDVKMEPSLESIMPVAVPMGEPLKAATEDLTSLFSRAPTLKANIRQERREKFQKNMAASTQAINSEESVAEKSFFDPRMKIKTAVRDRKSTFSFHQKGTFEEMANKMRAKAKLEKLQTEVSRVAKRTGISAAAKLAAVTSKPVLKIDDSVPDIEWWDQVLFAGSRVANYEETDNFNVAECSSITQLIEHPIKLSAPGEANQPQYLKVYLTKSERKKLRRQNRKEMQKEIQEKIRLGLEPPPEPKVKISNLMRVLGTQAIQDPTKMEAHVRRQMAARLKKHEEANAKRKLTPEERKAKKIRKMKDMGGQDINTCVFRVQGPCWSKARQFKVETNARQLHLSGVIAVYGQIAVVVAEGSQRNLKAYKHLMLNRIKWAPDEKGAEDETALVQDRCLVIWEGQIKQRAFDRHFIMVSYSLEKQIRQFFQGRGVEHYWDYSYSSTVLEKNDEII